MITLPIYSKIENMMIGEKIVATKASIKSGAEITAEFKILVDNPILVSKYKYLTKNKNTMNDNKKDMVFFIRFCILLFPPTSYNIILKI